MDLGSHMVKITRWCFGDVVEAKATWATANMNQNHKISVTEVCSAVIRIVMSVGWFSQRFQHELKVFGTAGHATTAQKIHQRQNQGAASVSKKTLEF